MAPYRAYAIGRDRHFVSFEGFSARDDGEAVIKARRLITDHDVEIWNFDRFVVRLESGRISGNFSALIQGMKLCFYASVSLISIIQLVCER